MRRFLYDALLILLLVLIGLSLDDSQVYEQNDVQMQMNQFQQEVKRGENVADKKAKNVMNQIEENAASSIAKQLSSIAGDIIKGSVRFVGDLFEGIVSG